MMTNLRMDSSISLIGGTLHVHGVVLLWCMLFSYFVAFTTASASWTYDRNDRKHGPQHWKDTYSTCGQNRQSPIRLFAQKSVEFLPFQGYLLDSSFELRDVTLTNNGHTVEILLPNGKYPIYNGGLPMAYYAAAIHLHWGHSYFYGAEHENGLNIYAMEMHIIHYKSSYRKFEDAKSATNDRSALAVFSFLFKASPFFGKNPYFMPIVDAVNTLRDRKPSKSGVSAVIPHLRLGKLVHEAVRSSYFRYEGSLTTPPCTENVVWTIFDKSIHLYHEQVHPFRRLIDSHGKSMEYNYRPVQPLQGRTIEFRRF